MFWITNFFPRLNTFSALCSELDQICVLEATSEVFLSWVQKLKKLDISSFLKACFWPRLRSGLDLPSDRLFRFFWVWRIIGASCEFASEVNWIGVLKFAWDRFCFGFGSAATWFSGSMSTLFSCMGSELVETSRRPLESSFWLELGLKASRSHFLSWACKQRDLVFWWLLESILWLGNAFCGLC